MFLYLAAHKVKEDERIKTRKRVYSKKRAFGY